MVKVTTGLLLVLLFFGIPATAFSLTEEELAEEEYPSPTETPVCEGKTCVIDQALAEALEQERLDAEAARRKTEEKRESRKTKEQRFFLDETDFIDAGLSD